MLPLGVIFCDVTLGWLGSYPVKVSLLALTFILIALAFSVKHVNTFAVMVGAFVLAYSCIVGFFSFDYVEFWKTFLQLSNFIILLVLLYSSFRDDLFPLARIATRVFLAAASLHAVLIVAQFISFNLFESYTLLNPLGPLSPIGPSRLSEGNVFGTTYYTPNPMEAYRKPNGLYSEPSVAAWISSAAFALSLVGGSLVGRVSRTQIALLFFGTLLTATASGVINLLFLTAAVALLPSLPPHRTPSLRAVAILGGILTILASILFGISERAGEFSSIGRSGYFRVVAPLRLVSESLPEYPLGHGLGQIDYMKTKNYLVDRGWTGDYNYRIDNSFLYVIYYFGVCGIMAAILVLWSFLRRCASGRHSAVLYLAAILALAETGGVFSPKLAILLVLIFIVGSAIDKKQTSLIDASV